MQAIANFIPHRSGKALMKVEKLGAKEPTTEELRELEQLKRVIDQATADGILTIEEIAIIQHTITTSKSPTADHLFQEMVLFRQLVSAKVSAGELISEELGWQ